MLRKCAATTMSLLLAIVTSSSWAVAQEKSAPAAESPLLTGEFHWQASPPLVEIVAANLPASPENPWHAVKDPSLVRYDNRWHLFCTLRKQRGGDGKPPGYIRIGYLSFADWPDAATAKWELLSLSMDYHGAPQVFYFSPHKRWYLIYQLADASRGIAYGPCYSTTTHLGDAKSWSAPEPFYAEKPENLRGWIDFWIICDDAKAHLFFTSNDGRMWRAETRLADFPRGFGTPQLALQADIFEASQTYKLAGLDKYLTIVEAQGQSGGRGHRYYKAYVADRLEGEWQPLAATGERPFAGLANVTFTGEPWSDSISHGELVRSGHDERLEVDPARLRFLYQGLKDDQWSQGYGRLAWRLGLLEQRTKPN